MRRFRYPSKLAALGLVFASAGVAHAWEAPSFDEVRNSYRPSEARLLDRHGEILQNVRVDRQARRLPWVRLEEISPALKQAVLLSEDRAFETHSGVDWWALARAAGGRLFGEGKRGASTLTMQLAGMLDPSLKARGKRRDLNQKLRQIRSAWSLERSWSKAQILEAYLNRVSFRGELQGLAAASEGLFGKAPSGLDREESWILAALLREPAASVERVGARACWLERVEHPAADCSRVKRLAAERLARGYFVRPDVALAPHLARALLKEGDATSTLDRALQAFVREALARQILSVRDRNVQDAAALVVENRTGEVLAYVGSVAETSHASQVDGARARRQAGSTLKPFIYGLAFERNYLTPSSFMSDTPMEIPVQGRGVYRPRNYDDQFHGDRVTVREALASSLNIPAVRTLDLVGVDSAVRLLERAGFADLREPEHYGASLALGAVDLTLWDLVNAYRSLANGGLWSPMRATLDGDRASPPSRRVLSRKSVAQVLGILSDRESRHLTFGWENPLATPFWTAVKTGTSKDMRDNWCIGFSERYTVGVWVGNFSGEPMKDVTGITGAAPIWAEIMQQLHRKQGSRAPGWVLAEGAVRGGATPLSSEDRLRLARITYPVNGMIVAQDPDIPRELQRIFFEANVAADEGLRWSLNGAPLSAEEVRAGWWPKAGDSGRKFSLDLRDSSGRVLDQVHFEIRG